VINLIFLILDCFQDYPRLQPTDTFINIGGIQIPKENEAENAKALQGMSEVKIVRLIEVLNGISLIYVM
jgi:hypothetical protein